MSIEKILGENNIQIIPIFTQMVKTKQVHLQKFRGHRVRGMILISG